MNSRGKFHSLSQVLTSYERQIVLIFSSILQKKILIGLWQKIGAHEFEGCYDVSDHCIGRTLWTVHHIQIVFQRSHQFTADRIFLFFGSACFGAFIEPRHWISNSI